MNSYPILSLGICSLPNSPINLVDSAIKYRIGIHSESIRTIPISVSEPMRITLNQSEKRFVFRLMKNGKKSIRPNPI